MKKLLIAIAGNQIEPDCFKSIYGLEKPKNFIVQFDYAKYGYGIDQKRNLLCQEALDYNFDYILMVDSDLILPSDTLIKLISWNKEIIFGWYPRRCVNIRNVQLEQTELFWPGMKDFTDKNNIKISELKDKKLIEIKGGGMGCALIHTSVLKKLQTPEGIWFKFIFYSPIERLSEDNYFCVKASEAGYKIFCDSSVRCGHISKFIL